MHEPMDQDRAGAWTGPLTIAALLVIFIGLGVLLDLLAGAALTRGSQSWMRWLLGMLGLVGLYLLGEGAVEWIQRRDTVEDPLPKRLLQLSLLLAVLVVIWLAGAALLVFGQ